MSATPSFTATPRVGMTQATAANANRDGTGTLYDLITGGANGTRVENIRVMGVGTVTGGMLRFYLDDGTNVRLIREVPVTATTPSATIAGWSADLDHSTLDRLRHLPSTSWKIRVSTEKAETFNFFAFGGDY